MTKTKWFIILLVVACVGVSMVFAQRYSSRRYSNRRRGVPDWEPDKEFSHDVFTFVRIRYSSGYGGGGYGGRYGRGYGRGFSGGSWATDYPDSDLNFSFRLHQLTSMEVNPDGVVLELTDPKLFDYPFIYIVEPGRLVFSEEEVKILRRYLLNGGFLMVDDFWGEDEWYNFYREIKRVFPNREPVELPLSHPIFHAVFDLKEKPQIPSIGAALQGRSYGITWEPRRSDTSTPHYKAIYDDKGRMMSIICHNTDLGDGWEREGEDEWYFREFSEKKAYPLGINIVFYAMTH
ncbi:MAG: DUF4159 domain-containing protein [Planctomycetes bacterium]|nr:DUF4159 domain-containing protein [Planctomycetota bacterium]MCH8118741.1 DUF4159 domain-containing protein [Planctomycetota bacterium]